MKPIEFDCKPSRTIDKRGNVRWKGRVGGVTMARARLVMMNYLHTAHIPKWMHIHHGDAGTECDEIWNLTPLLNSDHTKLHHPASFSTPYEYEKNRRLKPEVKQSIRNNSLKWYHKNKNKINSRDDKKIYKKEWYLKNKNKILNKLHDKYNDDEEYRNKCIAKAKNQKLTNKLLNKELCG